MRALLQQGDDWAIAEPDGSNYLYVLFPNFVHLVHKLDGSVVTMTLIQFQTMLLQAQTERNKK